MQTKRKSQSMYIVDGNLARQLEVVREPNKDNIIIAKQKKRKKIKKAKNLKIHKVFLIIAIMLTVGGCVILLNAQMKLKNNYTQISKLEKNLNNIEEENLKLKEQLNKPVDLNKIYDIATNKLGMIENSNDKIIYYDKKNTAYMNQLAEVPVDNSKDTASINLNSFVQGLVR